MGVARSTVSEGIKRKRIQVESDGKILWQRGRRDWQANADIGQQRNKKEDARGKEKWQEARTRREIAEADMAELELKKKLGEVLDAKILERLYTNGLVTLRNNVLGVSRRVAPSLVGLTDENEIADKIYQENEIALASVIQDIDRAM